MTMTQLLGRRPGGRASGGSRCRPCRFVRPRLEQLEDRRLLSSGLDPTFGNGGVVLRLDNNSSTTREVASQAILQPDGKIVVTADIQTLPVTGGMNDSMLVERFNADGSLDTTFGLGGMVSLSVPGFQTVLLGSSTIEPDGKIVVTGQAGLPGSPSELVLIRLNGDGSPDTSFGGAGCVALPIDRDVIGYYEFGQVTLLPDGKFLESGPGGLARFNPDGNPDTTFGPGGTGFVSENLGDITGLVVEANGTIVVAAQTPPMAMPLWVTADGQTAPIPKRTGQLYVFGGDGLLENSVVTFGPVSEFTETVTGLLVQSDGRIVLAGTHGTQLFLARYNPDGTPDTSFGTDGTADFNFGTTTTAYPVSVAEAPDGDLIVATAHPPVPFTGNQSVVIAFAANGSVDANFGTNGEVETDFNNPQSGSWASSLFVQPDGNILVDAQIIVPGTDGAVTGFALARLVGNGSDPVSIPPINFLPPINYPPVTRFPTLRFDPVSIPVIGEVGGNASTLAPLTQPAAGSNAAPVLAVANAEKTPALVAPAVTDSALTAQAVRPTLDATSPVGTASTLHPLNLTYFGSGGGASLSIQDAAFASLGDEL
jgi:uncharacterized delta-60 repeat protein